MTTALTLRSVKGSPLTEAEVDGNFTALRATADGAIANVGTAADPAIGVSSTGGHAFQVFDTNGTRLMFNFDSVSGNESGDKIWPALDDTWNLGVGGGTPFRWKGGYFGTDGVVIGTTPFALLESFGTLQIGTANLVFDPNALTLGMSVSLYPVGGDNTYDIGTKAGTFTGGATFGSPVFADTEVTCAASNPPLIPGSVVILSIPGGQVIVDDGAGNLINNVGTGAPNTVDYSTGTCDFSFASGGPYTGCSVTASTSTMFRWRTGYFGTSVVLGTAPFTFDEVVGAGPIRKLRLGDPNLIWSKTQQGLFAGSSDPITDFASVSGNLNAWLSNSSTVASVFINSDTTGTYDFVKSIYSSAESAMIRAWGTFEFQNSGNGDGAAWFGFNFDPAFGNGDIFQLNSDGSFEWTTPVATPSVASTAGAKMYTKLVGGKVALMVLFPSGAEQPIAVEV